MAEEERVALTAIRDMSQEGFIATSLQRLGWKVAYRATSLANLKEKLSEFPEALLLISDDFGDLSEIHPGQLIKLRGKSHPAAVPSSLDPQSEFELGEIIRERDSRKTVQYVSATSAEVIAISSIGGQTSSTVAAITVAELISQTGVSVLLVEGNRFQPKIAFHFQQHNIRGEITATQFGFSLGEATDLASLQKLAQAANSFDFIIVDLGPAIEARAGGLRVEDLLISWTVHSRARRILIASDDEFSTHEVRRYLAGMGNAGQPLEVSVLLTSSRLASRKERKRLIEERSGLYGASIGFLSNDPRSIERMEKAHSTLSLIAPASPILGDIAQYLERGRYS